MFLNDGGLEIRPVDQTEIDAVLAVYEESEDFLELGPVPKASMEMVLADLAHSKEAGGIFCGILQEGRGMIGVVDFVPRMFEGEAENVFLALLMIAKPHRGFGIGDKVVRLVEAEIRKDPAVRRILSGVQVNNPRAIRFWNRMGYLITGGPETFPDRTTAWHTCKQF